MAIVDKYSDRLVAVHLKDWLVTNPEIGLDQWYKRGRFCELGVDAMLGERVWDVQGRFRLRVGPLSFDEYHSLLPGGGARGAPLGAGAEPSDGARLRRVSRGALADRRLARADRLSQGSRLAARRLTRRARRGEVRPWSCATSRRTAAARAC